MNHCYNLRLHAELAEFDGYPDEVAQLRSAADEIERLQAIVDKLPVTADGVPVVPGAKYFLIEHDRGCLPLIVEGYCLNVSSQSTPLQLEIYETVSPAVRLPGRLYSSHNAAEREVARLKEIQADG